ncbi:MAG: phospho-N-acetylmuramoyl-pentapeptide-transferase [Cyanobacteria bacterium]|nr:phospho-N-acetylmuramoyl-pentapeptide-transferase [Cyanobacteriota bacterium]MDW8200449.1 phospho-N-acetylmuramoyl-pentapeptide-transferase [Cyanobacteriota bacterium SKYGB_h_bin112]
MDAKYFGYAVKLTGLRLFLVLWIGLISSAILLDWAAGRQSYHMGSLALPMILCAVLSSGLGFWAVPLLRRLKMGQFIREDGPKAHLKKAGTPTMGGIFVVPVGVLVAIVGTGFAPTVVAAGLMTLAYGMIGWLDDWQILVKKNNKGISPRMKLGLQILFAVLFCWWAYSTQPADLTTIALPFGLSLPVGLCFWVVAGFALVAESNATNLTDGVDGLAAGVGAIVFLGLGAAIASVSPDLMVFAACMAGSYLGFLVHNHNPARVFMGDTGSLAMGGALGAIAILTNSLWMLVLAGIIFVAETLSVVAQVSYYKATKGPDGIGKRLLRMAPLHHHFELSGWHETKVVGVFYLVTAMLTIVTLLIKLA